MSTTITGLVKNVERGPSCLFVTLDKTADDQTAAGLADEIQALLKRHFARNVVVEVQEDDELSETTVSEFSALRGRLSQSGGMLRLCGISDQQRSKLDTSPSGKGLPKYCDRHEAMSGGRSGVWPKAR